MRNEISPDQAIRNFIQFRFSIFILGIIFILASLWLFSGSPQQFYRQVTAPIHHSDDY